jgi:multiple sugar transport system substrate-binding protein
MEGNMFLKSKTSKVLVSAVLLGHAGVAYADSIKVSGWHQLFDFSKPAILMAEKKYEEKNAGTDLIMVDTAFGQALQQATVSTIAGNPSDVIQLVAGWVPAMAEIGGLQPLDNLLTQKEINSIPKTSRDALSWDGDLVAVPWNPGPILMHYNRNLMKEAGLDPDNPPKTWPELKEAVMAICKLPERNGGSVYGVALRTSQNPNSAQWSVPIVYGHGGDVQVDNVPQVNNQSVSRALNWIADVVNSNCSPVGFGFAETRTLFAQERAGFIFEGPWGRGLVKNMSDGKLTVEPDGDVWVAQMPAAPDGNVKTIGNPIVATVSSKSKNPELAVDFIRTVLFDKEITDEFFTSSGLLPSSSMDILGSGIVGADAYAQLFVDALPFTYDTPIKSSKFNMIMGELAIGMQEVISGANADDVLVDVQAKIESKLKR